MKIIILILAFIVVVQGLDLSGLRMKFEYNISPGKTSFYDIPRTLLAAIAQGFNKKDRCDDEPMQSLNMYCYYNCHYCPLYDDIENIAGVQIGIPQDQYSGSDEYDLLNMGYKNWTTTVNGTYKSFYIMTVYFCSEETLAKSKEERLAEREVRNETLQEGFFLINKYNEGLMKISTNESDLPDMNFTMQSFLPWMGRHYYYNMSSTTECCESTLLPFFPLTHNEKLIGVGIYAIGTLNIPTEERNCFEAPGKIAVEVIVPKGSQCFYELADTPGIITTHIYFIDKPWWVLW